MDNRFILKFYTLKKIKQTKISCFKLSEFGDKTTVIYSMKNLYRFWDLLKNYI